MQRNKTMKKAVIIIHNNNYIVHSAVLAVVHKRKHCTDQVNQSIILILTHSIESHADVVTGLTPWELWETEPFLWYLQISVNKTCIRKDSNQPVYNLYL